jgi:signal transduction histidine kinase
MRSPTSLQTRLILSHLLVALISLISMSLFAGSAILNAARNEAEQNLDTIALTTNNSLQDPMRELLFGPGNLSKVQQVLLQLNFTNPGLLYAVYDSEGSLLVSSENFDSISGSPANMPEEVQQALQSEEGRGASTREDEQGILKLYVARQIHNEEGLFGVFRAGIPLGPALSSTRPLLQILYVVMAVVAVTVSLSAWILARNLTRPILNLTNAASQIAGGDLETRVKPEGPKELLHLAEVFNTMTIRLQGYVDELRAFAANASHELRTPLTIVKLRVDALRSGAFEDPPTAQRFLNEIEGEVDRLARMVTDLLDLSRMEAGLASKRRDVLDLRAIADDVCDSFKIRADRAQVNIVVNSVQNLPTLIGNEDQLHRLVYNFIDNALRYSSRGTTIKVTLSTRSNGEFIRLEVTDSGPGIAPDHLPHIFERFYRAEATRPKYGGPDKTSSGTGLGLAIAKSIVDYHGGRIGVSSDFGHGSTFWAELPTTNTSQ